MSTALKKAELITDEPSSFMLMFERLATNKDVDVAKLQQLIAMQEHILAHQAKAAFTRAFALMQPSLPEIAENGQILARGILRSTYAKLEDIQAAIKPILKEYGFAMRHRTEWPADKVGIIRIVGILSHEEGHSEESVFEAPLDKSEYRTDIQSMGSTVSYGRRYTMLDLLNITTRGQDNDGAKKEVQPEPPAGYDDWATGLVSTANHGESALKAAWEAGTKEYRYYITKYNMVGWKALRDKAARIKS